MGKFVVYKITGGKKYLNLHVKIKNYFFKYFLETKYPEFMDTFLKAILYRCR